MTFVYQGHWERSSHRNKQVFTFAVVHLRLKAFSSLLLRKALYFAAVISLFISTLLLKSKLAEQSPPNYISQAGPELKLKNSCRQN